jgi:hypothetical protein
MASNNSGSDRVFDIEIEELDLRNPNEAVLDQLLHTSMRGVDSSPEDRHELVIEAVERYLQAVRRRNRLRRNWHPEQSRACDIQTLGFIAKDKAIKLVGKTLRKALTQIADEAGHDLESLISDISETIVDGIYEGNRGRGKKSLTAIITEIYRTNPNVSTADVLEKLDRNRDEYGIINIDDIFIEIDSPHGKKDGQRKVVTLKISSIPVILSRLRRKNRKTAKK